MKKNYIIVSVFFLLNICLFFIPIFSFQENYIDRHYSYIVALKLISMLSYYRNYGDFFHYNVILGFCIFSLIYIIFILISFIIDIKRKFLFVSIFSSIVPIITTIFYFIVSKNIILEGHFLSIYFSIAVFLVGLFVVLNERFNFVKKIINAVKKQNKD